MKLEGAERREQMKLGGKQAEVQAKQSYDAQLKMVEQQHSMQMEDMKGRHAALIQKMKDDASMDREIEDNAMAWKISEAKREGAAQASVNAGAKAGNSE
jgi:hypothetical protein